MIECPSCGHENVPGTQFCEGCGEELAAANSTTDDAMQNISDATAGAEVRCPACDNMNPADNAVCEVCGTELPGASTAAGSSTLPQSSTPVADDEPMAMATTDDTESDDDIFKIPASAPFAGGDTASGDTASPSVDYTESLTSTDRDVSPPRVPSLDKALTIATEPTPADTPDDVALVQTDAAPSNLQPGKVKLVVEQGMSVGKQFVLGDAEVAVGREDEDEEIYPDIDLSDQDEGYVHREHAKLNFSDGNLSVTHLGGANKTRVNNRPIPDNEAQSLKLGDKVSFGKVVLRVLPIS